MDIEKLKITKTILPELYELDTIPLLPAPKELDWKNLSKSLQEKLKLKHLKLESEVPYFTQQTQLPYPHFTLAFHVGSLEIPVFVLVGKEEMQNLACHLLGMEEKEPFEEGYLEGFKDFLIAMAIHTLEKQLQSDGWTLKASDAPEVSSPPYLQFGVKALIDETVPLDLLVALPKAFLDTWRSHYQQKGYRSAAQQAVQSLIELTLSLDVGWVKLEQSDLEALQPGDFVCADTLKWIPGKKRGRAFLSFHGHPLFLTAVKAEGFKIVEQANHYEIEDGMAKEEEDEFFDENEIEEGEIEEEEEAEDLEPLPEPAPEAKAPPQAPAEGAVSLEEQKAEKFTPGSAQVLLKIEIGRMKMTLDKLMQLEPGNILKLNTNLENGVNLIVNDKMIGRGELVSIGEIVGVRILNLGE